MKKRNKNLSLFLLFIFRVLFCAKFIDEPLHQKLFYIDIKAQAADKCKKLQIVLILFLDIRKALRGVVELLGYILCDKIDSGFFKFHYFIVDIGHIHAVIIVKILVCNRRQEGLDIFN